MNLSNYHHHDAWVHDHSLMATLDESRRERLARIYDFWLSVAAVVLAVFVCTL